MASRTMAWICFRHGAYVPTSRSKASRSIFEKTLSSLRKDLRSAREGNAAFTSRMASSEPASFLSRYL